MKSWGLSFLIVFKKRHHSRFKPAFTIVELLVVIVVIGVLAAITTVSYTGIAKKATVASLISDLNNSSKLLKMDQVTNMSYPTTLAAANGGKGIPTSPGVTYDYIVNNSTNPPGFCITATKNQVTYKITENSNPTQGNCIDYGLVLSLDSSSPASYPGTGTSIYDLTNLNTNITSYDPNVIISNSAFDFTASNTDGLSVQNNNFSNLKDFTMECVFNLNGAHLHYDGALISSGDWNNSHWSLGINQTNTAVKTRKPYTTTAYAFSLNSWYHIYFTRSSTKLTIFINGSKIIEYTSNDSIPLVSGWNNTAVGRETYANGYFNLNGKISVVKIYNRALSIDEMTQNFNTLRNRYGIL